MRLLRVMGGVGDGECGGVRHWNGSGRLVVVRDGIWSEGLEEGRGGDTRKREEEEEDDGGVVVEVGFGHWPAWLTLLWLDSCRGAVVWSARRGCACADRHHGWGPEKWRETERAWRRHCFFWGVLMGPRAFAVYGRNQPACMVVMVPGFGKMKSFRVVFLFIYDKYYSVIY